MRLSAAADDLIEWLGLRLNLGPWPLAPVAYGLPTAHALLVAERVGVLRALSGGAARTPAELSASLRLAGAPTHRLLELLVAERLVRRDADGRHRLAPRAARWLDPASPTSVGPYLAHAADYPAWWERLEAHMRTGEHVELHAAPADDPAWARYVEGQHVLARLSASEVARAVRLPTPATSLLDLAGAHGTFAVALCQRHPALHATVLDLPASAAAGEAIARRARGGAGDRVTFVAGDLRTSSLGGPHDAVLCFDVLHHLDSDALRVLLARVRAALRPGGTIAVLDLFRDERARRPRASAAALGLFFSLTSGGDLLGLGELQTALHSAGFDGVRDTRIRRLPDQRLVQARAA